MTAIAEPVDTRARPSAAQNARWAISDALVITRRNLLVWMRVPAYLVFTVVQPVIFVLLFRYVFGGAIHAPGAGGYVSYLMPGIIGQTAAFATFATAIALAQEAKKGVIDRFRAMPMARSAVLAGRLIADSIRMMIVILVIVGVGYAVGFRFQNGVAGAVGMVLLAEAFGVTVCAVSAFIGLAIKDEESVQAFGLIWLFPLTFISSAFVPIATMPTWLQDFANNQPVTLVINAMRSMALGGPDFPLNPALWESLLWLAGVLIVFVPLAVWSYRRVG
jgi:ABC transporter DrrB family efflux protein